MQYKIDLTKTPSQIIFDLFNNDNGGKYTIDQFKFSEPLQHEAPITIDGYTYNDTATLTALVPLADINTCSINYNCVDLEVLFSQFPLRLLSFYLKPDINFSAAAEEILKVYGLNVSEGFEITLDGGTYYLSATANNVAYKGATVITPTATLAERLQNVELKGFFGKDGSDIPPAIFKINPPNFKLEGAGISSDILDVVAVKSGVVTLRNSINDGKRYLELLPAIGGDLIRSVEIAENVKGSRWTALPGTDTVFCVGSEIFVMDMSTGTLTTHPSGDIAKSADNILFNNKGIFYSLSRNSRAVAYYTIGSDWSVTKHDQRISGYNFEGYGFNDCIVLTTFDGFAILTPDLKPIKTFGRNNFVVGYRSETKDVVYLAYGLGLKSKVFSYNIETRESKDITDTVPASFLYSSRLYSINKGMSNSITLIDANTYFSSGNASNTARDWYMTSGEQPPKLTTKPNYYLDDTMASFEPKHVVKDDYGWHNVAMSGNTANYTLLCKARDNVKLCDVTLDAEYQDPYNLFIRNGKAYWTRDDMSDRGGHKYLVSVDIAGRKVISDKALHIACRSIQFIDRGDDLIAIKDGKAYRFDAEALTFSEELYVGTDVSGINRPTVLGNYLLCGNNAEKTVYRIKDLSKVGTITRGSKYQGEWSEISFCGYDAEKEEISIFKSINNGATIYGMDIYKLSDLSKRTADELITAGNLQEYGKTIYRGKFQLLDGRLYMAGKEIGSGWDGVNLYSLSK